MRTVTFKLGKKTIVVRNVPDDYTDEEVKRLTIAYLLNLYLKRHSHTTNT